MQAKRQMIGVGSTMIQRKQHQLNSLPVINPREAMKVQHQETKNQNINLPL